MKKTLFVSIVYCSLFLNQNSFSQSGWFWQNPLPQGNDLSSVSFLNQNTGFAVGSLGAMVKTTDKGETWRSIELDITFNYSNIKFTDSYVGYLLRSDNKILKTTNSGTNWEIVFSSVNAISNITFCNANVGYLISDRIIFKTTNGGINWFNYFAPTSNDYIVSIFCLNETCVYLAGRRQIPIFPYIWAYNGVLYSTTNSGSNWNIQTFDNTERINSVFFLNSSTGFVAGDDCYFAKSINSGFNWQQISVDTLYGIDLSNIHFMNDQTGFVFPNYRTTNGGLNWNPSYLSSISDLDFPDNNSVISVGRIGSIFKSSNSGSIFVEKSYNVASARLNSINCVSDNVYYAAGGNGGYVNPGVIVKTTNGGKYWFSQQSGINNFICKIRFLNELTGAAVSPMYILHTANGGVNWVIQRYNSTSYHEDILFLDENTGFTVGRNGLTLKTTNGGLNWINFTLDNTLTYTRIFFINQQTGFILGLNWSGIPKPTIFKTTNRGINWISYYGSTYGNDIYFINENIGFTVGWDGEIFRTTNGGTIWDSCVSPTTNALNSVAFINEYTGFINGRGDNTFLKSTNSGLNWYTEYANLGSQYMCIWGISSINGVAAFVGDYGLIKSTRPGGGIGIKKVNESITTNYFLFQNFPNPFNPVTKIKFCIAELPYNNDRAKGVVSLKIYDILGKEISTLVNEKLNPGTYEVNWNAVLYPSGVYFYKLTTDNYTETKRMVLIR